MKSVVLISSICFAIGVVALSANVGPLDAAAHTGQDQAGSGKQQATRSSSLAASSARGQRQPPADIATAAASAAASSGADAFVDNLMGANNQPEASAQAVAGPIGGGGGGVGAGGAQPFSWPFGAGSGAVAQSGAGGVQKGGSLNYGNFNEMSKLLVNPTELIHAISVHFGIPKERIIEQLGGRFNLNIDTMLNPMVATIKIIEKSFVPDACRLRWFCQIGSQLGPHLRQHITRISPQTLGGSATVKALSQGISGSDCNLTFEMCEPRLKKPLQEYKQQSQQSQQSQLPQLAQLAQLPLHDAGEEHIGGGGNGAGVGGY